MLIAQPNRMGNLATSELLTGRASGGSGMSGYGLVVVVMGVNLSDRFSLPRSSTYLPRRLNSESKYSL